MFLSLGLFVVRKTPKLFCLLLTIINIILIFFVINGATHDSDAYSNLQLVEYRFNSGSQISEILSSQYSSKHDGKNITEFSMKVGFLGTCLDFGGDKEMDCGYTSDMKSLYENDVPSFSVSSGTNSTTGANLKLFDICEIIQKKTTKYQIFIVELIFLLVLLVSQLYNAIAFLPFQQYIYFFIVSIIGCFFTILCISITWLTVTIENIVNMGEVMTMDIIEFEKGQRVQNLVWAVFALTIVQSLYYFWDFVKERGLLSKSTKQSKCKKDVEKDSGSLSDSVMSSISTLRDTL